MVIQYVQIKDELCFVLQEFVAGFLKPIVNFLRFFVGDSTLRSLQGRELVGKVV